MKKLDSISEQIKSTSYVYTGKGSFEQIVIKNSSKIKEWLNNLMPLAEQITNLNKSLEKELRKRNYTRLLSKLFENEYEQFVAINILIRDSIYIAILRKTNKTLNQQYEELKSTNKLKYPGRHIKFVTFSVFREFVTLYNVELSRKANSMPAKSTYKSLNINEIDKNKTRDNKETINEIMQNKQIIEEAIKQNSNTPTNWTDILIGKN